MPDSHCLEFDCQGCNKAVRFSLFEIEHHPDVVCAHCHKKYLFDDATLLRQLEQFAALCGQILESEEILGLTSIGVDVGHHHVKIPFKLLLTRLSSCLDLQIGSQKEKLSFRFEPLKDTPKRIK